MLDLRGIDLEEIATAPLADQTDYEHRWLIDPRTGQVAFWTSDTGIDGENPVELDELDLIPIDPLPSHVWFQDMADSAEGISDREARRDLTQSLKRRGAFRRFKNQVYEHHPRLISSWHALRDARAQRRAVEWLLDQELIDDSAAETFVKGHPDPGLPLPAPSRLVRTRALANGQNCVFPAARHRRRCPDLPAMTVRCANLADVNER